MRWLLAHDTLVFIDLRLAGREVIEQYPRRPRQISLRGASDRANSGLGTGRAQE